MIGLDTNVLVRITQDNRERARPPRACCWPAPRIRPGYISSVSLCELAWVLRHTFGFPRERVLNALQKLLDAEGLQVENEEHTARGPRAEAYTSGAGFADRLIAEVHAAAAGVTKTLTFDRAASKLDGWRRLPLKSSAVRVTREARRASPPGSRRVTGPAATRKRLPIRHADDTLRLLDGARAGVVRAALAADVPRGRRRGPAAGADREAGLPPTPSPRRTSRWPSPAGLRPTSPSTGVAPASRREALLDGYAAACPPEPTPPTPPSPG